MTQTDELNAVKRKIRALTSKTVEAGASEAEAMSAMAKVDELLQVFNLTLNDVLIGQEAYITKSFDVGAKHIGIAGAVAVAVGRFTETKVWMNRYYKSTHIKFFGTESDVEMAVYLMDMLSSAFNRAYSEFKDSDGYKNYYGHRKPLHANFMRGFASKINNRLDAILSEREESEVRAAAYHAEKMKDAMIDMSPETAMKVAEATTGTALISTTKAETMNKEFKKLGMKLKTTHSTSNYRYNGGANTAGQGAASNVNLGRPVNGKASGIAGYLK